MRHPDRKCLTPHIVRLLFCILRPPMDGDPVRYPNHLSRLLATPGSTLLSKPRCLRELNFFCCLYPQSHTFGHNPNLMTTDDVSKCRAIGKSTGEPPQHNGSLQCQLCCQCHNNPPIDLKHNSSLGVNCCTK